MPPITALDYLHPLRGKVRGGGVKITTHGRYVLAPSLPPPGTQSEMLHAVMHHSNSQKPYCLLTVITVMALAASIHGTDKAVMDTGYRMLGKMKPQYVKVILDIINSPSPLKHMNAFVASLPDRILTMKVQHPALPMLNAG